jgi:hypothetical protein
MVAPPAVSCAKARTLPEGKGKGKAKAGLGEVGVAHALQEVAKSVPVGICAEAGVYDLLCFCCPMPDTETYRKRYVPEEGPDTFRTRRGHSIIDLHSEFAARKAAGESAIRVSLANHPQIFHQDEELAAIIAQCEHRKGNLSYGPPMVPDEQWLTNMVAEHHEEPAPGLDAVRSADEELGAWKDAKAGSSIRPAGATTLHTMITPSGPVNLGWSGANRFSSLGGPLGAITPSEVTDNA